MTLLRKLQANQRNSRRSTGPRTADGKGKSRRNALRHGLAAVLQESSVSASEVEEFARELCGGDIAVLQYARVVANLEMALRAIRGQQVAVVERLRERNSIALARGDQGLQLGKSFAELGHLRSEELDRFVAHLELKYKDEIAKIRETYNLSSLDQQQPPSTPCERRYSAFPEEEEPYKIFAIREAVPLHIKLLVTENDSPEEQFRALQEARRAFKERSDREALDLAAEDLIRLDRYLRRTWSKYKKALRELFKMKSLSKGSRDVS